MIKCLWYFLREKYPSVSKKEKSFLWTYTLNGPNEVKYMDILEKNGINLLSQMLQLSKTFGRH